MTSPVTNDNSQTNAANANNSAAAASAAAAASVSALSVNDFLTLMTAQLQNQDPTQPLDPSTFVAQLGTVAGVDSMQTSLASLSSTLLANQALSSATLVGQTVLTQANSAQYTAGQSLTGAVQ